MPYALRSYVLQFLYAALHTHGRQFQQKKLTHLNSNLIWYGGSSFINRLFLRENEGTQNVWQQLQMQGTYIYGCCRRYAAHDYIFAH